MSRPAGLRAIATVSLLAPTLVLLALSARAAKAAFTPGDNPRTLTHDSNSRAYRIRAPISYDGTQPVPLVVDLHGFGSSKEQQQAISGMQQRAEVEGFLVAYPDGLFQSWNAGVCCGDAVANAIDDVGFLRAMVSAIQAEGNVDVSRIYTTGLSNGGAMTHRLACEAADLFAAAAPLAFPTPYADFESECQPSRPIPVLLFMGLSDVVIPYESGAFGGAVESFDFWRTKNSCGPEPIELRISLGGSFCDLDESCADETQIGLCSIRGSALAPPLDQFSGHILYVNDDGLDLSAMIWSFFEQGSPVPERASIPFLGHAGRVGLTSLLLVASFVRLRKQR